MQLTNKQFLDIPGINRVTGNDLLLVSEETSDRIYTSKKIEMNTIFDDVTKHFESAPEINFDEKWSFKNPNSFFVDSSLIRDAERKSNFEQIINIEYACNNFIFNKLNSITKTLYRDRLIPSYVGEIIYSTTLKNEQQVQQRYGKNTNWKQISGRFIFGVSTDAASSLSKVNVFGGEQNHQLLIDEIPEHAHKINASTEKKKVEANFTANGNNTGEKIGVQSSKTMSGGPYKDPTQTVLGCEVYENKADAVINKDIEIYGNKGADAKIQENRSSLRNHNNMPPFISVYIWERIS